MFVVATLSLAISTVRVLREQARTQEANLRLKENLELRRATSTSSRGDRNLSAELLVYLVCASRREWSDDDIADAVGGVSALSALDWLIRASKLLLCGVIGGRGGEAKIYATVSGGLVRGELDSLKELWEALARRTD